MHHENDFYIFIKNEIIENLRESLSLIDDDCNIHSSCSIHQVSSRSKRSAISGSTLIGNNVYRRKTKNEIESSDLKFITFVDTVDFFVLFVFDAI